MSTIPSLRRVAEGMMVVNEIWRMKMEKFIKVERSDADGSYILPFDQLKAIVEGEFDSIDAGVSITLKVVEMEPSDFKMLAEFPGW